MRVIILGLGVQGLKRRAVAGADVVATVDPLRPEADYRQVGDVPLPSYDAALVCTPDQVKIDILTWLLDNGKHVLVEKPLLCEEPGGLQTLRDLATRRGVTCYTAYNHRFEPHFVRMKALLDCGDLGQIYTLRLFYGNGTARLVRESGWKDQGSGVLPDLGSHLLDTLLYWLGRPQGTFTLYSANCFENRAPDHCTFGIAGPLCIHLETTLLSWRNHFMADILAEAGSAHIESLCKWGPSRFTVRRRKLPSGYPDEESCTLVQPDPTWALEYRHFLTLCESGAGNLDNDIWINDELRRLGAAASASGSTRA